MHQRRIAITCSIAALVGLLLPAIFGGKSDIWGRFFYDFQTLISGLAAVLAATATIVVMQKTEARQERRHHEILELSLRGDRLLIERALVPQVKSLEGVSEMLGRLKLDMLERSDRDDQKRVLIGQSWMAVAICQDLIEFFERPALKEGLRLFDGALSYKVFWLEKKTRLALMNARNVQIVVGGSGPNSVPTNGDWFFTVEDLYTFIMDARDATLEIVVMMKALGERYNLREF